MTLKSQFTDGALVRQNKIDSNGVLHGRLLQPERLEILRRNAELRRNPDALKSAKDLPMTTALCIPELDLIIIKKAIPALTSSDKLERELAWAEFIKSPLSEPYRVRDHARIIKQ